jgi:transposase-like protein
MTNDLEAHVKRQQDANDRAEQIRLGLQQTGVLFARAIAEHDWRVLQYESVGDWAVSEFGPDRFSADRRKEIVNLLTKAGLTQRAIAAATGASQQTVNRDQAEARDSNESQEYDAFGEQEFRVVEMTDEMPLPAPSPRQDAARAREAERRRSYPLPVDPMAHFHVFDRCACGAVKPQD